MNESILTGLLLFIAPVLGAWAATAWTARERGGRR